MMQKQKIDLYSWKPEDERAASAMAAEAAAKKLNPSQSRVVDPTEVDVVSDEVLGGVAMGQCRRKRRSSWLESTGSSLALTPLAHGCRS